jgi:putative tryptophan/tyrosine transport system substrate-binding protein
MRRREFITLLGGAATAWPLVARAQHPERVRRIGVLFATGEGDPDTPPRLAAMRAELQKSGWIEDKSFHLEVQYGRGDTNLIQERAAAIVQSKPDVLLVLGTVVASAVQKLTNSLPVVFVQVSDPVQAGFVSNIARPSGNITGFTTYEYSMVGKWLEVLKEVAPSITRVLVLLNPENGPQWEGYTKAIDAYARSVAIQFVPGAVRDRREIESSIGLFALEPNGGMIVPPDAITNVNQKLIIALSAQHRVPTVYPYRVWAVNGGLLSYGIDVVDHFRQATRYVVRILNGERPGDLPIQAPTEFKMVVNLKTAKALGLEVPATLLARADEVIE